MYRETITGVDQFTATRIANLWNETIGDMLEGLRTDLSYVKAEGSLDVEEVEILQGTERTLYRLDSGEQHGNPVDLRDAVQGWLAYFFRSAETPVGMNLAPVYRLAAELSDLAEVIEQAARDAEPNDPWATSTTPASA
ncbi:hypothetical protein [Streptomyces scabiei]|uniref:hypothetical protein n=1 Tax=Streptomyces scabiei TaxID=1930 RepID=UPI0004E7B3F7|nr:hypothetical protein [Streptomyces scabiei]KFG05600.1 hypothetical protein IQ61_29380 [Streptomyces scabiei]MDX2829448.1 hypothetical protein [Streptomyces scabiei]MDX3674996.1 hypothetical protein [Streptomyces scabiei]